MLGLCALGAAIAGAVVQWLRDNLKLIEKSSDVEDLAKTVDDNGGIYFVRSSKSKGRVTLIANRAEAGSRS